MKKHIIIALFFTLFCGICHAQPFAGLKVGTDLGLEAGFKGKKFSVKAYSFTDYTSTRLFVAGKKDTDAHEGNRYILAYGVGAGFKLPTPFGSMSMLAMLGPGSTQSIPYLTPGQGRTVSMVFNWDWKCNGISPTYCILTSVTLQFPKASLLDTLSTVPWQQ